MLPCEVLLLTPNSVEGVAFFPWVGVFDKFMSQVFKNTVWICPCVPNLILLLYK